MAAAPSHLQLRGEDGFKLQAQGVLAGLQRRRRPLLVAAQVLQRLLSSFSSLKLVHHLTRKQVGAVVAPTKRLLENDKTSMNTEPKSSAPPGYSECKRFCTLTSSRRSSRSLVRTREALLERMAVLMTSQ